VLAERLEVLRISEEPNIGREEVDRFCDEMKVHARLRIPTSFPFTQRRKSTASW